MANVFIEGANLRERRPSDVLLFRQTDTYLSTVCSRHGGFNIKSLTSCGAGSIFSCALLGHREAGDI